MTMRYTDNCPAVPESFDPGQPVSHSRPVHHTGILVQDHPPACLWAQLQYQRERGDDSQYLVNLEAEWQRRDLCSGCLRVNDHPLMVEVDQLRRRAAVAESKLAAISEAARLLPDGGFKMAAIEILDREEPGEAAGPEQ